MEALAAQAAPRGRSEPLPGALSRGAFWGLLIAPALTAPLPALLAGAWPHAGVPVAFVVWALLDLPHWLATWSSALLDKQMRRRHRRYLVVSTALILAGSGWLLAGGELDPLFNIRLWLAMAHCVQMNDHLACQLDDPHELPGWIWKLMVIVPPLYMVGVPVSHGIRLFGQPVYGTALFAWMTPVAKLVSIAILIFFLVHLGAALRKGGFPQRLLFVASTWSVFLWYDLFDNRDMVLMGTIAAHSIQYAVLSYTRHRARADALRRSGSRLLAHLSERRLSLLAIVALHSGIVLFLQHRVAPDLTLSAWFLIFPLSMAHIFYDALLFSDRSFRLLSGLARSRPHNRHDLDLHQ